MPQYTENLSDGGRLIVSKDDWSIRYVDWPRIALSGQPDLRFNPTIRELTRTAALALVAELTAPWDAAEKARELFGQNGGGEGSIQVFLPGGYLAEVTSGSVKIKFPTLGFLSQSEAAAWSAHYSTVIAHADKQQDLLVSFAQFERPSPAEVAKWTERLDTLVAEWSPRRTSREVIVKVAGRDKEAVGEELRSLSSSHAEVEGVQTGRTPDSLSLLIAAPSQWDAERYVSLFLTLWGHGTSLRASASR